MPLSAEPGKMPLGPSTSLENVSSDYLPWRSLDAEAPGLTAWYSSMPSDPRWDGFLRASEFGQFQQSSLWSQYKAAEGWSHHRVVITDSARIYGGFQILWKKTRAGRVGYVSKGPVAARESEALWRAFPRLLRDACKDLSLLALIVQPPDFSSVASSLDPTGDFLISNPMKVVEATYLVDVRPGIEALRVRMSASLRRNLRKGHQKKTIIRAGGWDDLPRFFDLMVSTCQRQNTLPNPGSLAAVQRLWKLFEPSGSIRLTLAECDGAVPAAKLSFAFGPVYTVWKKGWDGSHNGHHPNELLEEEALDWAHRAGFASCDFCSFGLTNAQNILAGTSAESLALSSRDEYHLRFGGAPKLLPRAQVLIPNALLRWGYGRFIVPWERRRAAR